MNRQVSIPRSGFCSFRLEYPRPVPPLRCCFNPSVGILFVQTPDGATTVASVWQFQSLGRDSVRSDLATMTEQYRAVVFQSLGRDSVRSDEELVLLRLRGAEVSIPRSGFCSFRQHSESLIAEAMSQFQSLGRDSVRSDHAITINVASLRMVSIPRSGFCSFRLPDGWRERREQLGFNPSVGILFVQTAAMQKAAKGMKQVSIPRSGFCSFRLFSHHWASRPTIYVLEGYFECDAPQRPLQESKNKSFAPLHLDLRAPGHIEPARCSFAPLLFSRHQPISPIYAGDWLGFPSMWLSHSSVPHCERLPGPAGVLHRSHGRKAKKDSLRR